jgi:phospholipid/cholesterol/gamma-HCH transport system substrate-binding protein
MDKSYRKHIILGLFVVVGVVLFIVGLFQVGSRDEMFKKTFVITTRFANASGLKAGSIVRYNGVKVGNVKAVSLINDTAVRVDMRIEEGKRQFILQNVIASIASDGLMGDKFVNLTASKNPEPGIAVVANNDNIKSRSPLNTDEIFRTLSATNENVKVISDNLKKLTTDLNSENGTIQALYKDPQMAKNLKNSFGNLNAITGKVLGVSKSLQQITDKVQNGEGTIGGLINDTTLGKDLAHTLTKLKQTSDELNKITGQLSVTMDHVNKGNGAVNMFLTDSAFSADIKQSMSNIKVASEKLDTNMDAMKHNFLFRGYYKKKEKESRR